MELARFKPFLLGVGIILGAIVVVFALKALKPQTEKEETTKPPLMVRTVIASHKEQVVFSTFQGDVRAKTDIELVTQVTGKVMLVSDKFIEGGEFKAGETLLQIDDADYLVALKSAQASVASAQVDIDIERATAATNAKEWLDLQDKPIEEANPLRLNKPQIDRANARLDAAKAELAAAMLNYNRTKISAPFDGRIMSKSAELGQFMARGSSIGRVFATQTMEVRIPMTDVQISELGLTLGYSARAAGTDGLPATVTVLFGAEQHLWQGFVKSVDASVDSTTRLFFATVAVDNPFKQHAGQTVPLVPGLFVDVQLSSPNKLSGLQVPRTALRNGNQVYVYQDDKLRFKNVKTVYTSREMVILSEDTNSELVLGDAVITSPVPGAYEGMPIKLPEGLLADGVEGIESPDAESSIVIEAKVDVVEQPLDSMIEEPQEQRLEGLEVDALDASHDQQAAEEIVSPESSGGGSNDAAEPG
ncbi:MAG: efflux RND transporter periplasmic adaptor subunit [Arenicella sp.]|nr:efflux RND transporter periplasmic adaptor subunit [Arenicella sp.]